MKEFALYTVMRLAVFLASFAIVAGLWAIFNHGSVPWLPAVVIAAIVSMIVSVPLLNRQRQEFAAKVGARAEAALERARTREDTE
ncbi:DUF4229 domain-containing protein [Nocardioides sp. Kera G14]|uniref:DUF4229 domain-containing protein n=1 Tax=Nocardioides sp. Kera G14 TaxID=2884264 RepID=UPI001D12E96D|nr:DUF4229 domain-containing protein [Nocardioides sp. Kera G14]UDY23892.1 DUF4229 domain-containing protein [Nocardioides sp. Kera G14]